MAVTVVCAFSGHSYAATPERPYYVNSMTKDADITESIKGYQGLLSESDDKANKAQAYVKDGSATATITGDIEMDTRLIVREGTLKVSGATITQKSNGNYDFLMVGGKEVDGKNTVLELDNAQIIQTDAAYSGYMKSITVGNKDGEGTLIMKNGSVVKSGQLFHGGYPDYVNAAHGSYASVTGDETYFNDASPKAGHLRIESGSKLYAGSGYMICHMDMTIDGKGSEFLSATRHVSENDWATGLDSWLGDMDDCTSTVNITGGGAMKHYNELKMSLSKAETVITVSGADDEGTGSLFAAYHRVNMATGSEGAKVSVSATDNAAVHMTAAIMGAAGKNNEVKISIDKTSSYTGASLTMYDGAVFTNNGKVMLASDSIVTEWRDDRNIGLEASLADKGDVNVSSVDVISELTMEGGVFENNGLLSVDTVKMNDGNLVLGGGSSLVLSLDDTAALVFGDGSLELATDATLVYVKLVISNISTLALDSSTMEFVLAEGNTESVNAFYDMLEGDSVSVSFEDTEGTSLSGYSLNRNGEGKLVVTASVPEPTTATLSLLALAALAVRRRRR